MIAAIFKAIEYFIDKAKFQTKQLKLFLKWIKKDFTKEARNQYEENKKAEQRLDERLKDQGPKSDK